MEGVVTDFADETEVVDYTGRTPGELADGGRIEVCPACGYVALAVRYHGAGRHHPARYIHRRPVYSAEHPRAQQQQARDASRQSDTDSCYVDPAPRADGRSHEEAATVLAWAAMLRHQLILLESAVALGWYDRIEGQTIWSRFAALRPLMATNLPEILAIVRAAGVEVDDGC